jgi:acyl-CoA thioester hydrolase
MSEFKFHYPIQVRYGDLDPQWHVNNARYLTFMEQARFAYLVELDLWDGKSFLDLGLIIADAHISYLAPIVLGQKIQVAQRVSKLGNKSLTFEYLIQDEQTAQPLARGEIIAVSFDYHTHATRPLPDDWRKKISTYEGLSSA